MKKLRFLVVNLLLCLVVFSLSGRAYSADRNQVGVSSFWINGPKDLQYLSSAAQDAVVGALNQRGITARSIPQSIDPDKLKSTSQGHGQDGLLVAGRVNIVGETYRVVIKWVNDSGQTGQDYLEVQGLNQLIPQLEAYAKNRLAAVVPQQSSSSVALAQPAPKEQAPVPAKVEEKKPKEKPVTLTPKEIAPSHEDLAAAPAPSVTKTDKKSAEKSIVKEDKKQKTNPDTPIHDYLSISQRLPYEVRAMAFGDADGDGQDELILTGDNQLHVYRLTSDGALQPLAEFSGKPLDNFVKVDLWKVGSEKPRIVLTNLRGDQAKSQILQLENRAIQVVADNIPYQMRVVQSEGQAMLLGETYHATGATTHQLYELALEGGQVKPKRKLDFPYEVGLYAFDWVPSTEGGGDDLAALTPGGRLKIYKNHDGKLKGQWTSKESYGGSANGVPVEVKNFFNETVANYYIVPMGFNKVKDASKPDLVLAKNDALLKEILGQKPVVTDGKIVRAKWDNLGFIETWTSQKIDGSVMDFRIASIAGQAQVLVAVRLRNEGFFGSNKANGDSVLLVYPLN